MGRMRQSTLWGTGTRSGDSRGGAPRAYRGGGVDSDLDAAAVGGA